MRKGLLISFLLKWLYMKSPAAITLPFLKLYRVVSNVTIRQAYTLN